MTPANKLAIVREQVENTMKMLQDMHSELSELNTQLQAWLESPNEVTEAMPYDYRDEYNGTVEAMGIDLQNSIVELEEPIDEDEDGGEAEDKA